MLSNLEMRGDLWLLWLCVVKTKVLLTNQNNCKVWKCGHVVRRLQNV